MSSTDFSSLTKLPAEIRLQVWRLAAENALNPPRAIIELRNGLPRTIPVLSINAEARDEALSHTDLRSIPRFSLPEDRVHLNRLGLSQEDREEFIRDSPRDWYSIEKDVFVMGPSDLISHSFCYNPSFRNAIKTIAIPSFVLHCDGSLTMRQLRWQTRYMMGYLGLKTVILLRDDPEQEPISHQNLIQNTCFYRRTNDIRIKIGDSLSPLELHLIGFYTGFFHDLVSTMRRVVRPDWQSPEIKWGCLVRH
ncbi:hypothetical protein ACHAPC_001783 [Botrytis cinerea]|uniref:2EXR domain-containing protein n=1 Tax=Botryotinia fuckeliana (strain T4) TaxID=999810 RepID=G2Y3M4_BOTF4|nr:hypothetical protein BofuT4_P004230.1 [Botrytis cinerea T4]